MSIKFIIRKSQKTILTINIKEPRNSVLGELDLMIDSVKRRPFDKAIAGHYYMDFTNKVHAISWHGFYQGDANGNIKLPKIHFKDENGTKIHYKSPAHLGTINSNELFAFPICSLYIPQSDNWLKDVNISQYERDNTKYYFKDLVNNANQRIDIFVTPKTITANKILNSDLGYLYKIADITMFNTEQGLLNLLKEYSDIMNSNNNGYIDIYSLSNGHDLIIRTVGDQESQFNELEGTYSLLVHDPNDAYNRISNRPVLYYDENDSNKTTIQLLKDSCKL